MQRLKNVQVVTVIGDIAKMTTAAESGKAVMYQGGDGWVITWTEPDGSTRVLQLTELED